jgi:hypothetical protein
VVIGGSLSSEAAVLRRRAADLAAQLSGAARRTATIGQERAILRMLGVDGLDRNGRPLAAEMAERYCGSDRGRLARGVILPFAVALLEYDMPARELALEVASGAIDLGLEAELLERPDRLAAAESHAAHLLSAALERFDANKTAAHDMRDVLGMPDEPWLGLALRATEVEPGADEIKKLIGDGADVILVRVPASWEFAEARRQVGLETPGLFEMRAHGGRGGRAADPRPGDRRRHLPALRRLPLRTDRDSVPAGSQRGLTALRRAVDDAAAERGCYASLMTVTSAFAGPEQAVVAAFERIELVEADPIREIVEDNVDPERALADHAFAHRLHARAGSLVVAGAGPLALGADVARGIPANAETQAGRALALQALGAELALADGLPAERLFLGAVPEWVAQGGESRSILVQAWLRHHVFPEHRLVVDEPRSEARDGGHMASLVAALSGARAALVLRDRSAGSVPESAAEVAAAAAAGTAVRTALGDGDLKGEAAELARRIMSAADATLERLAGEGWGSVLGPSGRGEESERFGGGAVVERASGPTSGGRLLAELG